MDPVWGCLSGVALLGLVGMFVFLIAFGVILHSWPLAVVGVVALILFAATAVLDR
jgi:hypothetical protein